MLKIQGMIGDARAFKYVIDVKKSAELPLVDFLWRVVKINPPPAAFDENICFEYGESLWDSGHSWGFVRDKSLLDQPLTEGGGSVRIDCPNS
jgi:hypothetical protein